MTRKKYKYVHKILMKEKGKASLNTRNTSGYIVYDKRITK